MKKALIYILATIILLLTPIVLGTDWTQYTPSPISAKIERVETIGTYAMALSDSNNLIYYNGSEWQEISKPTPAGFTLISLDTASDNKFYLYYRKTAPVSFGHGYKIYSYNPTTSLNCPSCWTTEEEDNVSGTQTSSTNIQGFACIDDGNGYVGTSNDAECFIGVRTNTNFGTKGVVDGEDTTNITGAVAEQIIVFAERKLYVTYENQYHMYEWTGVSLQNRQGGTYNYDYDEISSTQRISCPQNPSATPKRTTEYNSTSGLFTNRKEINRSIISCAIHPTTEEIYFSADNTTDYEIYKGDYFSTNYNEDKSTINRINDISFGTTGNGWAVGDGGIIYEYTAGVTPPPSSSYELEQWVNPNPSTYGEQAEFHVRVTSSEGKPSNITMNIWQDFNLTILKTTTTQNNIPSGTDLTIWTLPQDSAFWTSYPPATYYYDIQAVTTDNTNATGLVITWGVITGETENVTSYEIDAFQTTITGINHIYSVSTIDETHAITSGENISTNKQHLIIFDSNNPTNIISTITTQSLTDYGGTNPNSIRDLKSYNDIVYVGTNDELYTFTNLTLLDANNLTYQDEIGFGAGVNDGIGDVYAQNSEISWVCQDGTFLENDDVYKYNQTSKTFSNKLNINPCHSLIYNNDYLYVHRADNYDVQIWNTTNQLSTIDLTDSISLYSSADLIDIRNNNDLYIISGEKEIKKYDVTNKSNPTEKARCYVENGQEITSIEALHDNEIAVGIIDTTNSMTWIGICDISNNETYNVGENAYEIQLSYKIFQDEISHEIQRLNENGKFHSAENTQYTIYYYEKTIEEQEINNPPVINQVTNTTDTPCLEQLVDFEIFASDPDNDTIKYESSCTGGSLNINEWTSDNTFSCSYDTTGTKNINIWIKDLPSEVVVSTTININVQDCIAPEEFHFKVIDITKAGDPDEAIMGAIVRVIGTGTDITDSNGYADFIVTTYQEYQIEWEAEGYGLGLPSSVGLYPSPIRIELWLTPDGAEGEDITAITIYTKNEEDEVISGSLVSISNLITTENRYGITDANGKISFLQMFTGEQLWVTASNEEQGYADTSTYTSLITNEQKTLTLILGTDTSALGGGIMPVTNRGCIDTIPNVYLCGDLSGDNNRCDEDSDCLSNRCMEASTPEGRKCSMFNYTLCDSQGINRGNTCIFKNTITGGAVMTGNLILDYFLYILIFLFVIIVGLIIKKNLSH